MEIPNKIINFVKINLIMVSWRQRILNALNTAADAQSQTGITDRAVNDKLEQGDIQGAIDIAKAGGKGAVAGYMTASVLPEVATYGLPMALTRLGLGTATSAAAGAAGGYVGSGADQLIHDLSGSKYNGNIGKSTLGFTSSLLGFGAGMNSINPLLRKAAGNGITFSKIKMPEETFNKLRNEYFNKIYNKVGNRYFGNNTNKLINQRFHDIYNRDALINEYLKFGRNSGMLIHGDPSATGVSKPLRHIAGPDNITLTDFPHFEDGFLVPSSTKDVFAEKRIFWGKDVPFFETTGESFDKLWEYRKDSGLKLWSNDQKIIKSNPGDFPTEIPYRYIVAKEKNIPSSREGFLSNYMSGQEVTTSKIPIKDIEFGFEYDPLTKTFNKVKYIDSEKKLFSRGIPTKNVLSRYYNNGYNWNNIVDDFADGRNAAIEYLGSDFRKSLDNHNSEIAHRIGFSKFIPSTNTNRVSTAMSKPNILSTGEAWIGDQNNGFVLETNKPYTNGEGSIFGGVAMQSGKKYNSDKMNVSIYGDIYDTAFHETLHRGEMGNAIHEDLSSIDFDTWKQQGDFYDWLGKKLIKPEYHNIPYYSESPEIAVNLLELGQRNGLEIGQQYPGKNKAQEIFKQLENDPRKGSWMNYVRQDKPKRLWRALTGKYMAALPLIPKQISNENK